MPLSTYAELQTSIADFLNRDDLTSTIPTFISLAEANINRDVRHWRMLERTSLTIASRYTTLPDDWIETYRITLGTTTADPLQLVSQADMQGLRADTADTAGVPIYMANVGSEVEVYPSPGEIYSAEITYYQRIPALADGVNWLLTYAPDVYLYGSLIHAAPYLHEDERAATWGSLYSAAVTRLNREGQTAAGTGLRMKMRHA